MLNAFAAQSITARAGRCLGSLVDNRPDLFITALIASASRASSFRWPCAARWRGSASIARSRRWWAWASPCWSGWRSPAFPRRWSSRSPGTASHAREELALALAIVLLGFLMMIVRRNAVTQVVGFMSMENGLILAATGARGMPLVVEVSVAFSVLIALFVFAVFVFRIRERFDTVDIEALDRMRGDRR